MKFSILTAFLVGSAAAVLVWQQSAATALRSEIAIAQRHPIQTPTAAATVSKAEDYPPTGDSDADKAETLRLKAELRSIADDMNKRMQAMPPAYPLSARLWRNVGTGIPTAAVETLLWAAHSGDVPTMDSLLVFTPEAQMKAEELYAALPPDQQKRYGSASRLISILTAAQIPTTSVIFAGFNGGGDTHKVLMMFPEPSGAVPRQVELTLNRSADGWKVLVPPEALEKYATQLRSADIAPSASH